MNGQIIKFSEQADDYADKVLSLGEFHPNWHDVRDEKFAELIVRECANYASRNWEHGHLLAEDLKVYFGVE